MNKIISLFIVLLFYTCSFAIAINDEYADCLPRDLNSPIVYSNYNFEPTEVIPIKLKVINPVKSEKELYEGQQVDFRVVQNVVHNDKIIIKRGAVVPAKISVIITPGMNGIPASIILKDFDIENIEKTKLTDYYEVFGQNRSLMVIPLKWVLTVLPPTGSLTNLIMGGHAKLAVKKPITIYYYPNWM
ncbi:hypothetical protein J6R97_02815 [bacterium]|nr:hypothetical protein [bacterium]